MFVRLALAAALLSSVVMPSVAQQTDPPEIRLQPVTIYAYRYSAQAQDVAASVTVVSGDEIEARNLTDMQQMVRYTPGVTVARQTSATDPFSSFGGFTVRGVGGNRVQMLVDGSRVAERITDGTRDYLDLSFTRQVDIAKGPASVLWGADALGGVVALTTIGPQDVLAGQTSGHTARLWHNSINSEAGASAAFAQQFGEDVAVLFGLSHVRASEARFSKARADGGIYGCPRNVDAGATPCNELDPTDSTAMRGLFKLVWTPNAQHSLTFSADVMRRRTDVAYNNGLGPVRSMVTGAPTGEVVHSYDRQLDLKRARYGIEHVWTPGLAGLDEVRTVLSFTPHSYDRTGARSSTSAAGERVMRRDELSFSEDFLEVDIQATSRFETGAASHELVWGFDGDVTKTDYRRRDVTTNLTTGAVTEAVAGGFNFANATTRRADIYIQDKITLMGGALEVTPGLRYATYRIDPRPDGDYRVTPGAEPQQRSDQRLLKSLGVMYRFGDGWQAWGHYGEGFKMPTAQQLYTSVPGTFFDMIPAPDLRPESVRSVELGIRRETGWGGFGVTAFRADYKDFIQSLWNIPGTNSYTARNLAEVEVWGVEMEGRYAVSDTLHLTASAAWQKGRQRASTDAARTPHTLPPATATLGLSWHIPQHRLTLDVVGVFAAGVKETASEDSFKPAGYGVVDVYAAWDITDSAALNLGVRNLFDKRYFEASAANWGRTATAAVAASNPIELQTGAGRNWTASLDVKF